MSVEDESDKLYSVEFLPAARTSLHEIKRYIAKVLSSPQAASSTVGEILAAADSLARLPKRRRVIATDPRQELRFAR